MKEGPFAEEGQHRCDNCGKAWTGPQLEGMDDFFERVTPGGVMPSGQCPGCGSLCFPVEKNEAAVEEVMAFVKGLKNPDSDAWLLDEVVHDAAAHAAATANNNGLQGQVEFLVEQGWAAKEIVKAIKDTQG